MNNYNSLKNFLSVAICALLLTGCTSSSTFGTEAGTETTADKMGYTVNVTYDEDDYYFDWQAENHETIKLEDGSSQISKSGIYELTGTLKDGSLTVNVDKTADSGTVFLVLNDATLNSESTAPINILEAKKVVLILENGTTNTITQGKDVTVDESNNPSAALFSKADLTIAGTGILNVETKFNDGITSKDDIKITGGTINIEAINDGITGKDLLAVETAIIKITAGKDGLRATNTTDTTKGNLLISGGKFKITSGNDAIQAENVLQIDGGTFDLNTGGGYVGVTKTNENPMGGGGMMRPDNVSGGGMMRPDNASGGGMMRPDKVSGGAMMKPPTVSDGAMMKPPTTSGSSVETTTETETTSEKGIKGAKALVINDGTFTFSTNDDSIHSNGDVIIAGGTMNIETGDDAVHADGTVIIDAGKINIKSSYEGIEGTNITINDGTIDIVSTDDGINVNSYEGVLTFNGGETSIKAGGDGLDSNGNIVQNKGKVVIDTTVTGPGDTPVDYDGTFTANGGTLVDQNGDTISHQGGMPGGRGNGGANNGRQNI